MAKQTKIAEFVTQDFIFQNHHQLSRCQFERLRGILPRPMYWIQPAGKGGAVLWNLQLLNSYLLYGADDPTHRKMVEDFVSRQQLLAGV